MSQESRVKSQDRLRLATEDEIENWDNLITQNPDGGDVFQSKAFAAIKAAHGWRPQYIIYDLPAHHIACLYLTRHVPLIGDLWYAPKGPGVTNREDLEQILKANKVISQSASIAVEQLQNSVVGGPLQQIPGGQRSGQAPQARAKANPVERYLGLLQGGGAQDVMQTKTKKIFAFKIEPAILKSEGHPQKLHKVHNIQPNANTVLVNLIPTEQEILASFRQRARRAIRQAQSAGVTAQPVPASEANYQHMYTLYKATAKRAGFHVRDFDYHKKLWQHWVAAGQGQLFFAYHQDSIIASAFVAYLGKKGLYKDGASDRAALKNGAAHLLQWEIMRWLKARGVATYDLHGTPPADELENKQHTFYGLGLFKTSFAEHITEYVGTLDQIINPVAYARWRKFGERAAQSLEYRLRNRTFY